MSIDLKKYRYKYSVEENDFDNSYFVNSNFSVDDLKYLAEDAADNYHSHHDGWESSWPLSFFIFDLDGVLLGSFEVEREEVPSFSATKKAE